ncbi:hypothetical protein LIA77_04277 [Sarocladium implicatum]|nr:hypothetical protein LIA77_04277 [Sarocladium implicatum]
MAAWWVLRRGLLITMVCRDGCDWCPLRPRLDGAEAEDCMCHVLCADEHNGIQMRYWSF